jgi:CRISPR type III-B/RAMP module RAMP protein Cmr6
MGVPEDTAASWQVVGPLSRSFTVTDTDDEPPRFRRARQKDRAKAAAYEVNARLILHRTALIVVGHQTGAEGPQLGDLDDGPIRAWAVESNLGQDRQKELRAKVAAWHARALESLAAATGAAVLCVDIEPQGAMVTGTGAGGIRNVGIELHGTHGWPVIPASTLKGAAAAHARDTAARPDIVRIFGAPRPGDDTGGQDQHAPAVRDGDETAEVSGGKPEPTAAPGSVRFFDALPGPDGVTVVEHVLTPHARDYHTGPATADDQRPAPAEYRNPVPIPFLAIEGGRFTMYLLGPEADVRAAAQLLADAVDDLGVGAKTSAGYGYFDAVIRPVPTAARR